MLGLLQLINEYRDAKNPAERDRLGVAIIQMALPKLRPYVYAMTSKEMVDDVLQEVWRGIFKSLPKFRGSEEGQAWSFCVFIARNHSANAIRKKQRSPEFSFDPEEMERAIDASFERDAVTNDEKEEVAHVFRLLKAVKPPCVGLLNLRYILELEYDEIAALYQKSRDAVRMDIQRCLKLAEKLAK